MSEDNTNEGGNTAPETVSVDVGGISIALPKDQAQAVMGWRDNLKAEHRSTAEQLGRFQAETEAAKQAAEQAARDKEAVELAKKGEIEQARALLTKQAEEREQKLAQKYCERALDAAVSGHPSLLKMDDADSQRQMVGDIVAQLRGSFAYNLDADTLEVKGPDGVPVLDNAGQPMGVDSFVRGWLERRPYYLAPTAPKGSGAAGGEGQAPNVGGTITSAQLAAGVDKATAAALAAGTITVKD